jgi:hypothetical protein
MDSADGRAAMGDGGVGLMYEREGACWSRSCVERHGAEFRIDGGVREMEYHGETDVLWGSLRRL